mmetsp:Transcript_20185/g.34485  ORF Transcript_20185/g.34485 Transcript_20185/m.34485 type:complete len:307 (+) Transcript_20185:52-972(+)
MCFNQPMSFAFAALGFYLAWYVHHYTLNTQLATGVFYFFLMEFLQGLQYFVIDDCDSTANQILTFLGFVHIAYQPYFTHVINSSLTKNPQFKNQYKIILRLCLVGGTMLLGRYFLYLYYDQGHPITSDFTDWSKAAPPAGSCRTTEWLRGEKLCTFSGKYHLAWSVPMAPATYWIPAASIHSFLMFAPFFVMKRNMVIQGIFLWLAGPFLASYITPNLMEQASIWCFFSIAQIGIMLFIIRESLILNWGRKDAKEYKLIRTIEDEAHAVADKVSSVVRRGRSKSPARKSPTRRKSPARAKSPSRRR